MARRALSNEEKAIRLGTVFSPAAPIREKDVFMGRRDQVRTVMDAINQRGQHVLIYGERGVGKTSLANVLAGFLAFTEEEPIVPHINCDTTDDYSSIWRKIFRQIQITKTIPPFGFQKKGRKVGFALLDQLPQTVTPEDVLSAALVLSQSRFFIPVIDEFDRLQDKEVARQFTDTIKALSDQSVQSTLVVVGVAGTVEELIAEHQSVERALVQVRMPRMSSDELEQIVSAGVSAVGMSVETEANHCIAMLSQGLPHYTHLLGLHSARQAIDHGKNKVTCSHVDAAIDKAITGSQQTLIRAYHKATTSPRSDNLYSHALLACALAQADQLGYFAAADVRAPMSHIMGKRYEIAAFSRHLADFCDEARGPVLERIGVPRRYRFRFRNPLLQPFVIMQGLANKLIERADLGRIGVE